MSCPFFVESEKGSYCKVLLENGWAKPRKLVLWVCHDEWESYCPRFFEASRDAAPAAQTELPRKPSAPDMPHLRHVNRLWGNRQLPGDVM